MSNVLKYIIQCIVTYMVTLRYGQQIFDIYARRTVHAVFR